MTTLNFQWINPGEIGNLDGQQIVLFGAGKGSEEFFAYLDETKSKAELVAVVDNDATFWGKTLNGCNIIGPEDLKDKGFDKIVVTSISGREVIADQLNRLGFRHPEDVLLIGRFPPSYLKSFRRIQDALDGTGAIQNTSCLHIGPGGFLGLEVLLYCFGASRVCSIDKFGFGIHFPDITPLSDSYAEIQSHISNLTAIEAEKDNALRRFKRLFSTQNCRRLINNEKIDYVNPADVCRVPADDGRFDMAFSFGVLEHVSDPKAAVAEIARTTTPGGISLHLIVTRDHRCNSKVGNHSPFAFRTYDTDAWETIANRKFYQNRLLPIQWRHLFEECGFIIRQYHPGKIVPIDGALMESFHPDFHRFNRKDLGEIDCLIVAEKAEAA